MKLIRYAAIATLVGALFPIGQAAFAQSVDAAGATAPAIVSAPVPAGKTRAEVRAELVQAEQQGLLPSSDIDYPLTPQEIAQNRADYQRSHPEYHASVTAN